jgi:hypothetical protein
MKLTRLALCGLLAAGWAFAQDTDLLEIRGIVVESGLNTGVAGAGITVYQFSKTSERTVFATAATDPQGNFRFHPTLRATTTWKRKSPRMSRRRATRASRNLFRRGQDRWSP